MRTPRVASGLVLALALAACGGQAEAPCVESDAASPGASPNANADPDLADTFPETVGGEPLEVATFCAAELDLGGIETSPEMLDELGVELADITVAAVPPSIGTPGGAFSVGAYRFAGADDDAIRETFLRLVAEAMEEIEMDGDIEQATVGGKDVHRALGTVFYVEGDTLYSVQSEDETKVTEILEALP